MASDKFSTGSYCFKVCEKVHERLGDGSSVCAAGQLVNELSLFNQIIVDDTWEAARIARESCARRMDRTAGTSQPVAVSLGRHVLNNQDRSVYRA